MIDLPRHIPAWVGLPVLAVLAGLMIWWATR